MNRKVHRIFFLPFVMRDDRMQLVTRHLFNAYKSNHICYVNDINDGYHDILRKHLTFVTA